VVSSWLQNGDVLCFLWGTNWIYTCYVEESRPPLWSSGHSSWLQNGDILRFLWGTNWIYMCYVEESRQPLWSSGQSSWLQNGDVLRFLWGTNWIYTCYVEESRPPLWSSGQSSWLQNRCIAFPVRCELNLYMSCNTCWTLIIVISKKSFVYKSGKTVERNCKFSQFRK
jgi:hypothetical protein